jgi:L-serine dehydratase
MRITYDFYQRRHKLPADQLAKATKLQVNLFGSLSATGKGHGTERGRARRTGRQGTGHRRSEIPRQPARQARPGVPGEARRQVIDVSLKDVIYDAHQGRLQTPEHDDGQAPRRRQVLLEQEYYSVGGGFIEWKGYTPPKKTRRNTRSPR